MFRCLLILVCVASASTQNSQEVGPRINDGDEASESQFPWHVILHIQTNQYHGNNFEACGGSIISREWILTAAHCLREASRADVYAGVVHITADTRPMSISTEFIIHEDYIETTMGNDIALIKLSQPLNLSPNVQPIALSSEYIPEGAHVIVIGAGKTTFQDKAVGFVLRYVDLVLLNDKDCQNSVDSIVNALKIQGRFNKGMVCAIGERGTNKNACKGDSGGPLVTFTTEGQPLHVGLVSFGHIPDCISDAPVVYTRTAYFRQWIKSKTNI